MSTKIYDGLISTESDPFFTGLKIRKILEPLFFDKFTEIYDELKALPEGSTFSDHPQFWSDDTPVKRSRLDHDLYNKVIELDNSAAHTFSDADIFYNVTLIRHGTGGNPLVLVYGENGRMYREALIEAGVVEDFGYWDNSDAEKGVDWVARREAWKHLADENAAPNEIGLGFSAPSRMQVAMHLYDQNR